MSANRSRVQEVLEHYGIYYEQNPGKFSELLYLCPFHDDHDVGSASFSETKEGYYCFSCSEGGSIYDFVARLEACSPKEAGILLDNSFRDPRTFDIEVTQRVVNRRIQEGITSKEYQRLVEAAVQRMLSSTPEAYIPLAVVLGSWMYSFNDSNLDKRYKQVLDLYEEFFQSFVHTSDERSLHDITIPA